MSSVAAPSRRRNVTLWVLRVFAAFVFLPAAALKLAGYPMLVQQFDLIGMGQWLRYATALAEIVGGIAVLMPRYSAWGAALLLAVDTGAFIAQLTSIHLDPFHPLIFGALLLALAFQRRWARTGA